MGDEIQMSSPAVDLSLFDAAAREDVRNDSLYADLCLYCTNMPKLLEKKIAAEAPERGKIELTGIVCRNKFSCLHGEYLGMGMDMGYKNDDHRMLVLFITYPDGSDRRVSCGLAFGEHSEILEKLRDPQLPVKIMEAFIQMSDSIRTHVD